MTHTTKRTILYVEDDEASRDLITFWLQLEGHRAVAVSTYQDGKRLAKRAYDLFVIDKKLPDADGFELCREIRAMHPLAPIILTSADCREVVKAGALSAGATLFVEKPIDLAAFGEVLRRLDGHLQPSASSGDWQCPLESSL